MNVNPQRRFAAVTLVIAALTLAGCGGAETGEPQPFASTYAPLPSTTTLIRGATILTGTGKRIDGGDILLEAGVVAAVGNRVRAPRDATIVEAQGRWITPGIIDVHSHLGVYPSPGILPHADGNEMSSPNTADVWAEHSIWAQDPGFHTALAGGVTTMMVLPGSANLFGGRGVTLRNVSSRTVQGMKFPDAPYSLKMACGENPKRVYGQGRQLAPSTRMGNVAGYRSAWIAAQDYIGKLENGDEKPVRDLKLETLAGVLKGEILVHNHCYRADEMAIMLDVAKEFGYKVTAFHHAVEAYKIADLLAASGTCAAMWADWWGFKIEAFDAVRENIPLVDKAGACAIVHSDSEIGTQRLNQEAAKAMAAANRVGMNVKREQAIAWITRNAAGALGVGDSTGTLERGKRADVVLWSDDPFSVYARADQVYIDGARVFDRNDTSRQPVSDFMLGILGSAGEAP